MLFKKFIYLILLLVILLIAGYAFQDKKIGKGNDSFTRYELVKGWPQLPDSFTPGNPTGIGIDTNQNIFIFHRANQEWPLFGSMPQSKINSRTIVLFDGHSGKILNSWGTTFLLYLMD